MPLESLFPKFSSPPPNDDIPTQEELFAEMEHKEKTIINQYNALPAETARQVKERFQRQLDDLLEEY